MVIQAEIIRSLQFAVKYDNAILDLTVLRDTSAVNREAALTTLSELRQRIVLASPFTATLQIPEMRRPPSTESIRVFIEGQTPPEFIPPGVTLTPEPESRGGLKRFLSSRRSSTGNTPQSAPSHTAPIPRFDWLQASSHDRRQTEPTLEDMLARLGSSPIGGEAHGGTGPVRNSSTSAGSTNSVHSGKVPSVASVSETTDSASPLSTSTP